MTDKGYDEQNMIAAMNREKMTDCTPECQYASIYLLISGVISLFIVLRDLRRQANEKICLYAISRQPFVLDVAFAMRLIRPIPPPSV